MLFHFHLKDFLAKLPRLSQYCSHHRQILGLQPRTSSHKRSFSASKKRVGTRSQEAHHRLVDLLVKQGIPQLSAKRGSQELARKANKYEVPPTSRHAPNGMMNYPEEVIRQRSETAMMLQCQIPPATNFLPKKSSPTVTLNLLTEIPSLLILSSTNTKNQMRNMITFG